MSPLIGQSTRGDAGLGSRMRGTISVLAGYEMPMGQLQHVHQELLRETRAGDDSVGGIS